MFKRQNLSKQNILLVGSYLMEMHMTDVGGEPDNCSDKLQVQSITQEKWKKREIKKPTALPLLLAAASYISHVGGRHENVATASICRDKFNFIYTYSGAIRA